MMGLLPFGTPFGFMAFLGVASLAGVIVSHVIVLFDYIEEACERGEPLQQAVIDSGLVRLRPVLVTVLATVGGLIPLAIEGGPLWEPMCYVQIAGLLVATVVTLGIVPVVYVVFVENLKLIRWEPQERAACRKRRSRAGQIGVLACRGLKSRGKRPSRRQDSIHLPGKPAGLGSIMEHNRLRHRLRRHASWFGPRAARQAPYRAHGKLRSGSPVISGDASCPGGLASNPGG